jgi:hypothetical protein
VGAEVSLWPACGQRHRRVAKDNGSLVRRLRQTTTVATLFACGAGDLLGNNQYRKINRWPRRHPEAAAWMLWRVIAFEQDLGLALAMSHLERAKKMGLHLIEPRLALMVCQQLLDTVDLDKAATVAEAVLANRTTDTAFDDLALWLVWTQHSAAAAARTAKPRNITFPKRARPKGRVSPNPFAPADLTTQ